MKGTNFLNSIITAMGFIICAISIAIIAQVDTVIAIGVLGASTGVLLVVAANKE